MAAGMCVPLVLFLSAVVLRCVSAGGVYCARTARARAAALGLDYPGVSGAPDLNGPAHHGMHPRTMQFTSQSNTNDGETETEPNMAPNSPNQPRMRPLDNNIHTNSHPQRFESTFLPSHGPPNPEYTTDQVHSVPRGQPVINHKSNFEQVKHVAPEAPGQPDLVSQDPQGRNKPPSYVHNRPDLVVDESVPNRRGMSLSGLSLPRSRGHAAYQRGSGLGREVPVLGSPGFANKGRVRAMTGRGPVVGWPKITRFPGRLAQQLHRGINVKHFTKGRYHRKQNLGPAGRNY